MTKRKKIRLIIIGGILLVIAILFLRVYFFFNAKPTIAVNYAAEWNRQTQPENYDANQNAYFDYANLSSFVKLMPEEMQIYGSFKRTEWPGDFNESELSFLKNWMEEKNRYFGYLKSGSYKSYYWVETQEDTSRWEIRNDLPVEIEAGVLALCWRAKISAFENRIEEALNDVVIGYKIGSQLNRPERKAFEQYFARRVQSEVMKTFLTILNNRQIDAELLADFYRKIKGQMDVKPQSINLNEGKLFTDDMVQRIFTDDGKGGGHLIASEAKKIAKSVQPSRSGATIFPSAGGNTLLQKIADTLSYIRYDYEDDFPNFYWMAIKGSNRKKTAGELGKIYAFLDQARRKKPYQFYIDNIDLEKQVENMTSDYLAQMLALAWYWPEYFELVYQHECEVESFLTVIALMRYKAQEGYFPDNLQELVDSGLIHELPQDPYNDGVVTYRRFGDNFTLYSYGTNFKDNSGEIVRDRYSGKIVWWDRRKRADAVFWPYPNERQERRLQRIGKIPVADPNALIKEYGDPNKQSEK